MEPSRAKVLTPAKFRHLLCVTEATSRFPERDTLILLLSVTCGMRVTEIARLEVHHVLSKSGTRKEEFGLPGSITKGCRPRCVFLSHVRTVEAFDRYVEWRYRRGHGVSLDCREYRGLMPRTRLIVTQKGGEFELSTKRRVNFEDESVEYLAADSLQGYVTGLYRAAGLGSGYKQSHWQEDLRQSACRAGLFARNGADSVGAHISTMLRPIGRYPSESSVKPSQQSTYPRECVLHNF